VSATAVKVPLVVIGVFVTVGDAVAVAVAVAVAAFVAVGDAVAVGVEEGNGVLVMVAVAVAVGVAVGGVPMVIDSHGAVVPLSRLARLLALVALVVSAKLYNPFPFTIDVTSTLVQVPLIIAPVLPMMLASYTGAFAYNVAASVQVLSATRWTSTPTLDVVFEYSHNVAFPTVPPRFCTLNWM
jgi:hypothetical protein